jgi:hypothetical protein
MKTDPFSHARGLTGETLRPPQRLQVQASLRVRRGLLLLLLEGDWAEEGEEGDEGAARPPLVPRKKTRGEGEGEGNEARAAAAVEEDDASTTE